MTHLTIDQRKNAIIEMMRTLPTSDCAQLLYDCAFDEKILNTDSIIYHCDEEMDALEKSFCAITKTLQNINDCALLEPKRSRVSDEAFDYFTGQCGNRYFA